MVDKVTKYFSHVNYIQPEKVHYQMKFGFTHELGIWKSQFRLTPVGGKKLTPSSK